MKNYLINQINSIDWEFLKDNTRYGTHDFHRYSSKFIPQIAHNLIELFSKPNDTILDIFLGSGTTCVEAELLGRRSIGIDLNPLAFLIAKVKTTPIEDNILDRDMKELLGEIKSKIATLREKENSNLKLFNSTRGKVMVNQPVFPNIEKWFQPQVLEELSVIKDCINEIEVDEIKLFFICAFSAILRNVSNAHSGYGNLMINKQKRVVDDTFETFERQILLMIEGMRSFNKQVKKITSQIYCSDSRHIPFINSNSIDLIVTHPPYISAVPYAEYQKLSLNWLKECFADVFDNKCTEYLNPRTLDKEIIGGQRSKANVIDRFMDSMELVFKEMYRVLKKGKYCCIVIGHPTVRGKIVELSDNFVSIAKKTGFNHFYTITRGNHRTTMGKMKKEYILILKKS